MKLLLKKIFLYSIMWPHILTFLLSKRKDIIKEDVIRRREYRNYHYENDFLAYLCEVLWRDKEYRNVFYFRIRGLAAFILNLILPSLNDVDMENCSNIQGGLVLIHGHGTIINRYSVIGKNCTILHGVKIGVLENTWPPRIGDNVYIAKVLGPIKIGNNVKIGAGAVVIKDVPDNAIVVGVPARILNK